MHLVILHHIGQQANEPIIKLKSDISIWKQKIKDGNTNELTRAILAAVILVADKLRQDRAVLLPHAVSVFLEKYTCTAPDANDLDLDLGEDKIKFSSRWLLHQLIIHFQPYMHFECIVNKLSTLLYPNSCDPLKCLSLALYDLHSEDRSSQRRNFLKKTLMKVTVLVKI